MLLSEFIHVGGFHDALDVVVFLEAAFTLNTSFRKDRLELLHPGKTWSVIADRGKVEVEDENEKATFVAQGTHLTEKNETFSTSAARQEKEAKPEFSYVLLARLLLHFHGVLDVADLGVGLLEALAHLLLWQPQGEWLAHRLLDGLNVVALSRIWEIEATTLAHENVGQVTYTSCCVLHRSTRSFH